MPPCVIVHVEDIRSIRFTTERVARQEKCTYYGFSNGEGALAFIQKYEVDVVLMDIDLAGGGGSWNGYETARRILELYPDQLIYSASAEKEIDNPLVGERSMFNGHLGKEGIANFIKNDLAPLVSAAITKKLKIKTT